ncbi:hypothetical protein APSETT445_005075 [Aspergillus pseudonomiae]
MAIVIICALELEARAVRPAFNEIYNVREHPRLGKARGDPNSYTIGRMGLYYVVLAHMPEAGKASACSVASNVTRSYSNIEMGFLVGICGAVPFRTDSNANCQNERISLGDVIIANGVIQYDLGRETDTGFFRKDTYHDTLGRPTTEIRTFLSKVRANLEYLVDPLHAHFRTIYQFVMTANSGQQQSMTNYSGHSGQVPCDVVMGNSPEDPEQRPPYVHFGLMASADRVLKSARVRDKLAKDEDVIGFEMEAAGVWENIPVIVVKGVSDYADANKDDRMQRVAAVASAACMRALVDECPISTLSASSRNAEDINLQVIDCLDFDRATYRREDIHTAVGKTCEWIFQKEVYQSWMDDTQLDRHEGFLWIKGGPGTGKSTLMKFILTEAERSRRYTITLSFFFHASGMTLQKSQAGMYRSLLYQFLKADGTPDRCKEEFMRAVGKMSRSDPTANRWDTEDLKHLLLRMMDVLSNGLVNHHVLFLIDAIDECEINKEDTLKMVGFLRQIKGNVSGKQLSLRFCLSRRYYKYVDPRPGELLELDRLKEHQLDIERYVGQTLRFTNSRIRKQICAKSAGVFLWVKLVVDSLNDDFDKGNVHDVQTRLEKIPQGLDNLYTELLGRDNRPSEELILFFQLILFSSRPLTQEELYFALFFRKIALVKRDTSHTDGIFKMYILDVSKGLVEVTASSPTKSTVQFIHESVREFMLGWFKLEPSLGKNVIGFSHQHLGVLCFDYVRYLRLGNRDFKHFMHLMRQKTYSVSVNNVIKNNIPFFGYAVLNLFYHSNEAQRHDVKQSEFLRGFSAVFDGDFSNFLFYYNSALANTKDWYNDATFLHFLCDKCLRHLVRQEVLNGSHAWQESGKRGCPMSTAVYNSDLYTIRALLGCTPEYSGSGSYCNVLEDTIVVQSMKRFLEAIPQGYKVLKSNKLPQGIDIPTLLLKYAVDGANVAVLTLLWCTGLFDFNQESVYGQTPLNWALEKRPAFLVYHLLNYEKDGIKVDINKPTHGNPPLKLAIQSKHEREEKINILLRHGSLDRSCLDARQCNACHWAVHVNDEGLLRRFIDLGFQMNHRGVKGRSPLSHAAEFCKVRMMEILLASDPTQGDEKDADGRSPLSWVAACCFPEEKEAISDPEAEHLLQRRSLEALLRFKVDVNSEDRNQRTPLMWAVAAGNRTAVQLLSSHKDTDINCCSRFEETPLVIAIMKGDPEIVKMLLQSNRADVNLRDINGRTPLSWALGPWHPLRKDKAQISHCRNPSIARLLFESGADLNITDTFKHTPLWWAQSYDVLLARGNLEIQTYHDSPLTVLSDYLSSLEIMRALQMLTHDEAKFKCEIRLMWLVCEKFGLQAKYPWTSEIGIAILD